MKNSNTVDNRILVYYSGPGKLIPTRHGAAARLWSLIYQLRTMGYRIDLVTVGHGQVNAELASRVDYLWLPNGAAVQPYTSRNLAKFAPTKLFNKIVERYRSKRRPQLTRIKLPLQSNSRLLQYRQLNPALQAVASKVAWRERPLAAIAVLVRSAYILDSMPPGTLRIVDTHDIDHLRKSRAEAAEDMDFPHMCTKEEEMTELNRADVIVAIQAEEQRILQEMCPDKQVLLVGHTPISQPIERLIAPDDCIDLLFVGSLNQPNILGAKRFLKDIWPQVRTAFPKSRLIVCGRISERLPPAPEGVIYKGLVPDLRPYYRTVAIVINPSLYGTGLKIKSVEALAYGKCLVTTSAGIIGLSHLDSLPCAVTPLEHMAGVIIELLNDAGKRRKMENAAWQMSQQLLNPTHVYQELTDLLKEQRTVGNP